MSYTATTLLDSQQSCSDESCVACSHGGGEVLAISKEESLNLNHAIIPSSAEGAVPELSFKEAVAATDACLVANHANTLALLMCLESCLTQAPYREAEAVIDGGLVSDMSMQNAHTLIGVLIKSGGIEVTDVFEPEYAEGEEKLDQPIGYLVQTSKAGCEVLDRFNPVRRLSSLIASEDVAYQPLYNKVLELCLAGAKTATIADELGKEPALFTPKRIYPEYFISKLETVGGLSWNGSWLTTQAGKSLLAQRS